MSEVTEYEYVSRRLRLSGSLLPVPLPADNPVCYRSHRAYWPHRPAGVSRLSRPHGRHWFYGCHRPFRCNGRYRSYRPHRVYRRNRRNGSHRSQ